MTHYKVAIVGGGLSGLYAAYLLEQKGITDYVLLEARDKLGGRILNFTTKHQNAMNHFDLGPSWFWPDMQTQLDALILQLGLDRFAQYDKGNMRFERSLNERSVSIPGYASSPASMRLKGGMNSLINTLHAKIKNTALYTSSKVKSLRREANNIKLTYRDNRSTSDSIMTVDHVLLALPPRLAIEHIQFIPKLPTALSEQWQNTETWMASHAKYLAVYEKPFWRDSGLSGSARSAYGPMVEIHDASSFDGQAALFGFLGIPAINRKTISETTLKTHCRAQLQRIFGEQADSPIIETIKDWSQDPFTATSLDLHSSNSHSKPPQAQANTGVWQHVITGIGSEWSRQFPGYIAGAIESSHAGVKNYLNERNSNAMV
ncbi:MAG: FAD-dependent oxidoreductase [Pseudomonadota bacterium]